VATHTPATEIDQAKVAAYLNARYHADREAWLDSCHRWLMFAVILFGSSALLDMAPWARAGAAFLTVSMGAFDLVFSLSDRARSHSFLRKQYLAIAAKLELPKGSLAQASSEMLVLSGDEEPTYYAVHALAENWATRAVFGPGTQLPCEVSWFRGLLRHLFRFDRHTFSCGPP
jgi:hypothetical protein